MPEVFLPWREKKSLVPRVYKAPQRSQNEVKIADDFFLTLRWGKGGGAEGGRGGECKGTLSYFIFRKKEALPLISANDVIALKECPVMTSALNNSAKTDKNCKTKVSKHSQSQRIKLCLAMVCFLLSLCNFVSLLSRSSIFRAWLSSSKPTTVLSD